MRDNNINKNLTSKIENNKKEFLKKRNQDLINVKTLLENNKINIKDIKEDQKDSLIEFYSNQIKVKKDKIKEIKKEIINIKK